MRPKLSLLESKARGPDDEIDFAEVELEVFATPDDGVINQYPINKVLESQAMLACTRTHTGAALLLYCLDVFDDLPSLSWEFPTLEDAIEAMRTWARVRDE